MRIIRINFSSLETRRFFLPDAENRTIVSSFVWTQYRSVMDGRTDRPWLLLRCAQRAIWILLLLVMLLLQGCFFLSRPSCNRAIDALWPYRVHTYTATTAAVAANLQRSMSPLSVYSTALSCHRIAHTEILFSTLLQDAVAATAENAEYTFR